MTDTELDRLEALADARTVDAEVRAAFHRLADAYRGCGHELARLREAARKACDERDAAVTDRNNAYLELERQTLKFDDRLDAYRNAANAAAAYARELRDAEDIGPQRTRLGALQDKLVVKAREYQAAARS